MFVMKWNEIYTTSSGIALYCHASKYISNQAAFDQQLHQLRQLRQKRDVIVCVHAVQQQIDRDHCWDRRFIIVSQRQHSPCMYTACRHHHLQPSHLQQPRHAPPPFTSTTTSRSSTFSVTSSFTSRLRPKAVRFVVEIICLPVEPPCQWPGSARWLRSALLECAFDEIIELLIDSAKSSYIRFDIRTKDCRSLCARHHNLIIVGQSIASLYRFFLISLHEYENRLQFPASVYMVEPIFEQVWYTYSTGCFHVKCPDLNVTIQLDHTNAYTNKIILFAFSCFAELLHVYKIVFPLMEEFLGVETRLIYHKMLFTLTLYIYPL